MLVASVPDINNTPNENVVFTKMKKAFMPHTHTHKKKNLASFPRVSIFKLYGLKLRILYTVYYSSMTQAMSICADLAVCSIQ